MTYFILFNKNGTRNKTYPNDGTYLKEDMLSKGYVEVSEDDWKLYTFGEGDNGTGYIYDMKTGRPISAPPISKNVIEKIEINNRISELKKNLVDTDYVVIKIAEGAATKEDYADIITNREEWRAEINELEEQLK